MKMKRAIALLLTVCMLLPFIPTAAKAVETVETLSPAAEDLTFERMDGTEVDLDLTVDDTAAQDLALEQEMVDENGMVDVFIIMEGESIIEADASAVMDESTQEKVEAMEENQAQIVAEIEDTVLEGETLEVAYNYTWLVNGVAAQIPYSAMADIEAIHGVKQVIVAPTYEIFAEDATVNTVSDGVMVGRENTWANGYTGKGIKIAIIDTGLDTDHQNFQALGEDKLTEDSATAASVAAVLENLNASVRYNGLTIDDVYYSTKVVFGFNYADNSTNITHQNDSQGDHGTHVAGIAAANKVDGSGVVGVAPDAQLFILKVFGYERAGSSSDIVAALEDALILGVDVVNMSLGSNAGFTSSANEFIDSIYARVAQTNTVLSVSAGNNYTAGYGNLWGTNASTTSNPDNAVIGEPAVYQNVLSVASVENWKIERNYIDVSGYQMAFVETSSSYGLPAISTLTGEYEVVPVSGYGTAEDFEGLDVAGKVALVQRGVESFVTKCENAAAAGAVACIIYNNTSGEFYMDLTDCTAQIPCVSITLGDGEYIIAQLEAGEDVKLSFPTDLASIPSVNAYEMSEFSSWGVAPDLTLEPDITAPGGNIYSTLDGGEYGLMSGTSMAAPNISGLSALVMQYVKENFDGSVIDYRTMVQNLLVSTSTPLTYGEDGLYYSPRSQGSGLANAYSAVSTQSYLTVDGSDTPKASLGDDASKTGTYSYQFNVTNFSSTPAFYALNTVVQTEGYTTDEAYPDTYFMSSTPVTLAASTAESSASMVLTYDVENSGAANSHDAYHVYRAAIGEPEDADWTDTSFRYDLNADETVTTDDVQTYLNALVGLDEDVDLADTVLCVGAGETAQVDVTVTLTSDGRTYLDTYYPNGGYVEGFTFLTARSAGTIDLSLPYLAFYGSWDEAPIIDDGNYWDLLNADEDEVLGNQYWNVLFSNFYGYESYVYPGYNVYLEEAFDAAHIAVSPNGDGYFDTIDDIYTSLLRNAGELTYRYTNTGTGEVYYEQTVLNISKSVYSSSYGQIIPNVYSWYDGEIALWDWVKPDGTDLDNNTSLLLEIEATGAYAGATADTWSVPVFVDLEAPELLSAVKTTSPDGTVTLELTYRDNHYVSAAALMDSSGSSVYYLEGVEDPEAGSDGYRTYTTSYDITGITGKLMILIADYAMNQAYYALNVAGEGTSYGELVAYQYNFSDDLYGWISFDPEGVIPTEAPSEEDSETETTEATEPVDPIIEQVQITMDEMNVVCAEYVNGFVFAQTETGALYGFLYEDMLKDTFDLETNFITQMENVYQDMAYNYADGQLYGLYIEEDPDGYPYSHLYTININGTHVDATTEETIAPYEETWACYRGGIYGLGLACDDDGTFYILCTDENDSTELWYSYNSSYGTLFKKLMDIDVSTDYLQSMTWDHNTETIYWAQFQGLGIFTYEAWLYNIDVDAKTYTALGTLAGETCAMFAPLTAESAAKAEHQNLPEMDTSIVATPVLREEFATMNVGSVQTLLYDLDPWYSSYRNVVWSTSDASVVTVDQNGNIAAVGTGSAEITVANTADATKCTTCTVQVTALDLKFEGIISAQSAGLGNTTGTSTYEFRMDNGISSFGTVNGITASDSLNYGLELATSVCGRGYIWACEYGNTGMVYKIDPDTGAVVDVLQPIDGDMMFGMTYNEELDTFTGIMNMYLYVDLELTHDETEKMLGTYDESARAYMYHRINLLPYLIEANGGFITGEDGQGASSEIVMCGITTLPEGYTYVDTHQDYMGTSDTYSVNYTADQTLVILDNVGRLWYIDEITDMTKSGGNYVKGESSISSKRNGVLTLDNEDGTYSVFYIRQIDETPLTTMFRDGTLPRITYHFSDIEYAGNAENGAPMFALSLYDYWNNGITNELYLYVAQVTEFDQNTYQTNVVSEGKLYDLGDTGKYNIIASIHAAEVTGGVDMDDTSDDAGNSRAEVNGLFISYYGSEKN